MRCIELLTTMPRDKPLVISLVGGGGKTSLLFALAMDARQNGSTVLVTTTTRIYDPRKEQRFFDSIQIEKRWAVPASGVVPLPRPDTVGYAGDGHKAVGFICVAGSDVVAGKLQALDPALIDAATGWNLMLVEADGARHKPLKAPADHEPVIPVSCEVVIAIIGLDCIGKPLDDAIAFRPELVARATGLALGSIIEPQHLVALALADVGCFKGARPGVTKVLVLNKLDTVDLSVARVLAENMIERGVADLVALATLSKDDPDQRIAVIIRRNIHGNFQESD